MKIEVGQKWLITTDEWFFAPDGETYRAVYGTVKAVNTDADTLGIKTNRGSSNWYICIGNMIVAGCQIHYAIQTEFVSDEAPLREIEHEGELRTARLPNTRIYFA